MCLCVCLREKLWSPVTNTADADFQIKGKSGEIMINKYQGVKNFTLVARMQNSSSILRPTDDESSMF